MRKLFTVTLVLTAVLALAANSFALEKQLEAEPQRDGGWVQQSTCYLKYFNRCTLWNYGWSGWTPGDRVGLMFDPADCCNPNDTATLTDTVLRIGQTLPTGYGFTGLTEIYAADGQNCPTGLPLASQPWLPNANLATYWQHQTWSVVIPGPSVIYWELGPSGAGSGSLFYSDLGGVAGPSGGLSCGQCFPCPRPTHSYYYGTPTSPLCPGSGGPNSGLDPEYYVVPPYYYYYDTDGAACEWRVEFYMSCAVSVEEQSWGSIKNLYR